MYHDSSNMVSKEPNIPLHKILFFKQKTDKIFFYMENNKEKD